MRCAAIAPYHCCNDELKVDKETFFPPKADEESRFDIFYPDSGGFGTKLILKGYNFGTDTNYIKVTVNDKKAKVIRANDNIIYAIVPSRADTGYVRLYLKKERNSRNLLLKQNSDIYSKVM